MTPGTTPGVSPGTTPGVSPDVTPGTGSMEASGRRLWDVVVVGGGVAGLSCALFTSRAGLSTIVIDAGDAQIAQVKTLWNIPGHPDGISGIQWLEGARRQVVEAGGQVQRDRVEAVRFAPLDFTVTAAGGDVLACRHLVLSVNLGYDLLAQSGLPLEVNTWVPSGKIRRMTGLRLDGRTDVDGLYVTGLLAGVPSQTVIAAGHGAYVGVQIASRGQERSFMWHD